MTFVYDVLAGRATSSDFDSYIAAWDEEAAKNGTAGRRATYHEIYLYTGMLWPEYGMYVEQDNDAAAEEVLGFLIEARRRGLGLWAYLEPIKDQDPVVVRMWHLCQRYSQQWDEIRDSRTRGHPSVLAASASEPFSSLGGLVVL